MNRLDIWNLTLKKKGSHMRSFSMQTKNWTHQHNALLMLYFQGILISNQRLGLILREMTLCKLTLFRAIDGEGVERKDGLILRKFSLSIFCPNLSSRLNGGFSIYGWTASNIPSLPAFSKLLGFQTVSWGKILEADIFWFFYHKYFFYLIELLNWSIYFAIAIQ